MLTSHTALEIWGRTVFCLCSWRARCSVFFFFSFFIGTVHLLSIGRPFLLFCRWLVKLFPSLQMIGQTVFHLCRWLVKLFSTSAMIGQTVFRLCRWLTRMFSISAFCFCRGLVKLFLSDCRPLVKQFPSTSAVFSSDWVLSIQWIGQTVSSQRMTGQTVVDLVSWLAKLASASYCWLVKLFSDTVSHQGPSFRTLCRTGTLVHCLQT